MNPITNPAPSTKYNPDEFMSTLQERLLSNQAVSSQDTSIETAINDAITNTKKGTEASKGAISSAYDRNIGYTAEGQQVQKTGALESGRGNATGVQALKYLDETNGRELKDLEQRKQELILQADANGAAQVSNLIMKKLEFRQQAQQQVFSNLLGMGNLAVSASNLSLQKQQEARLSATQSFAERSAINSIALKYGLKVDHNDTLDSITAKAAPFATQEQQLEIQKTKAEINRANAEASKALRGDSSNAVDPLTIGIMAQAALSDPRVLAAINDPVQLSKVKLQMAELLKPRDFKSEELTSMIQGAGDRATAMAGVATDQRIKNKQAAYDMIDKVYGTPAKPKPVTFLGMGESIIQGEKDFSNAILGFFTGNNQIIK